MAAVDAFTKTCAISRERSAHLARTVSGSGPVASQPPAASPAAADRLPEGQAVPEAEQAAEEQDLPGHAGAVPMAGPLAAGDGAADAPRLLRGLHRIRPVAEAVRALLVHWWWCSSSPHADRWRCLGCRWLTECGSAVQQSRAQLATWKLPTRQC
jgi:hypothetical protein